MEWTVCVTCIESAEKGIVKRIAREAIGLSCQTPIRTVRCNNISEIPEEFVNIYWQDLRDFINIPIFFWVSINNEWVRIKIKEP